MTKKCLGGGGGKGGKLAMFREKRGTVIEVVPDTTGMRSKSGVT